MRHWQSTDVSDDHREYDVINLQQDGYAGLAIEAQARLPQEDYVYVSCLPRSGTRTGTRGASITLTHPRDSGGE
jgi:hypothetical protein